LENEFFNQTGVINGVVVVFQRVNVLAIITFMASFHFMRLKKYRCTFGIEKAYAFLQENIVLGSAGQFPP